MQLKVSYLFAAILFIIAFLLDWYAIYQIFYLQPFITHWQILFPFLLTIFLIFSIVSLRGMYLRTPLGFMTTYLILGCFMLLLIAFYIYSFTPLKFFTLFWVIAINLVVLFAIIFYQVKK